ncbi:hypothetical protein TNCV_4152451 [Trichonephila clavipes]|nr:hypothetical protein TNCV_4152451 [Trichonephila clavipes]
MEGVSIKKTKKRVREWRENPSRTKTGKTRWDKVFVPPLPRDLVELRGRNLLPLHVGANMDGNGVLPRYLPCHEECPY